MIRPLFLFFPRFSPPLRILFYSKEDCLTLMIWYVLLSELDGLQVTPITTFLLVILAMTPCLVKAFSNPQPRHIIRWVSYACTCGFMFGWHVHEKASLHFTLPLALIAMDSLDDARHYFLLSIGMFGSQFTLTHNSMVTQFHLQHFWKTIFLGACSVHETRFFCQIAYFSI